MTTEEIKTNAETETNSIPATPEYNTDALTAEELEIFNDAKDLSDGELSALPYSMREEILSVRAKAKTSTETEPAPAAAAEETEPTAEVPAEKPEDAPAAETTTEAEEPPADNRDDIIRMLTEENRKLTARYSTLQGKYNAEFKKKKTTTAEVDLTGGKDGDTSELFSETADGEKSPASPSADEINRLAEQYGVDVDVAKALCGIVADRTKNFESQIAEERTHRLDATFDRVLRNHCGGLGLDEIGTHPLFNRYAADLVSNAGTSAAEDIAAAKANYDFDRAASIVNRVVEAMKQDNVWNFGYSRKSEPGITPAASPAGNATAPTAAKAKPMVVPHSSGNAVSTMQTARTEEDIIKEYNALEARLRKGDFKAAARMEQVSKEYSKLLASKNQS